MKKDIEWLKCSINTEREQLARSFAEGRETNDESAFNDGKDRALASVLRLLDKLDEPVKPVIPQFVAEWIERNKQPDYEYENKEDALADSIHFTLYSLEANYPETNPNVILRKPVNEWLDNDRKNYWKLIDGVRYGYEVEKEKLYKVELPTERLHHILTMHGDGKGHFFGKEHTNNFWYRTYLTEQEIKEIDPRYWVFAEEVTK